ncbi:MAG: hypothetical protein ACLFNR_03210 [Candidatus Paceibacterota bacterium]
MADIEVMAVDEERKSVNIRVGNVLFTFWKNDKSMAFSKRSSDVRRGGELWVPRPLFSKALKRRQRYCGTGKKGT